MGIRTWKMEKCDTDEIMDRIESLNLCASLLFSHGSTVCCRLPPQTLSFHPFNNALQLKLNYSKREADFV
jgi:hypothetical protein